MAERIAVAVIGCGFFAQNHLHSWKGLFHEGADLVAVCDVDPQKAKAAAAAFGVPNWFSDAEQMFQHMGLGLVDIVTRSDTHAPLVDLALRNRVPAVVQKPFGETLAQCRAMLDRSEQTGVFLAIHENFRFQKPMRDAAAVLRSGVIGEASWARISFRTGYDIYAGQPYLRDEERFIVIDLGTHVVDLARFFLGEIAHVSAETQRRDPGVRGEDTATMLLRHRSGAVSVVECTYAAKREPDNFPQTLVEIEGSRGAIAIGPGARLEVTANGTLSVTDVDAPVLPWASRPWHVVQESVFATCLHMLAAVRAGRAADTSARDNIRTFAACEAAYAAMDTRRAAVPLDAAST